MKEEETVLQKDKKVKLTKLQKSVYNARNFIDTIQALILVFGTIGLILIGAVILFGGIDNLYNETNVYNFINNKYVETTINLVLATIGIVSLWFCLKWAAKLLDNILEISIFSDETIKCFDKCLRYLIIYWLALLVATFELNGTLIAIILIVNLGKHIFIYGHNLEKEMEDVI